MIYREATKLFESAQSLSEQLLAARECKMAAEDLSRCAGMDPRAAYTWALSAANWQQTIENLEVLTGERS